MTSGGGRRRGHGQRLLYFFRTPPGVRVGRAPIDEDAIRLLEEHNPDVQFDWTRILKSPQPPEPGRREDRRDRRRDEPRPSPPPGPGGQPSGATVHGRASAVEPPGFRSEPRASRASEQDEARRGAAARSAEPGPVEPVDALESEEPGDHVEQPESLEPTELLEPIASEPTERGGWPAAPAPAAADWPARDEVEPRYTRLGAEGLARLRARYAEVMARITEKPLEEHVKAELRATAERLNPDAWVTEEEVAAALEQYETVFETLRPLVGRHPRGRRRRRV